MYTMLGEHDRRVLEYLAAEPYIYDPAEMRTLGSSTLLVPTRAGGREPRIMHRIVESLPDDLTPEGVHDSEEGGEGAVVYDVDGTRLAISRWENSTTTWFLADITHQIHIDDDSVFAGIDGDDYVNYLNISTPGITWSTTDGAAALTTSSLIDEKRLGDAWCGLVGQLYLSVVDAINRTRGGEHRVSAYLQARETLDNDDTRRFDDADVRHGVYQYLEEAPAHLRALIELSWFDDVAVIRLPFTVLAGGNIDAIEIHMYPVSVGEIDATWAQAGVHVVARVLNHTSLEESRLWCHRLNERYIEDGQLLRTGLWTAGNWRWAEEPGGTAYVVYHGFIPNRYKPYVRLSEVLAGVVGDVWRGKEHYHLRREFDTITGGGT